MDEESRLFLMSLSNESVKENYCSLAWRFKKTLMFTMLWNILRREYFKPSVLFHIAPCYDVNNKKELS